MTHPTIEHYRQQAVPGDPAETPRGDLAAYGPRSGDDRADIWSPVVVCMARDGAIIRSAGDTINARTTVQVIVTCPTTGLQHRITVPAWYGLPLQEGESAAARVRAAVAWTFGLRPDQYQPQLQS